MVHLTPSKYGDHDLHDWCEMTNMWMNVKNKEAVEELA